MKEMAVENGLEIYLTKENSPGKHHLVDRLVDKLMKEDSQPSLEEAVDDAVYKHNIRITRGGLSPRQLMFGRQGQTSKATDKTLLTRSP